MADKQHFERDIAGGSRRALLSALEEAGRPLGAEEVAARVGLHPNTARGHLDLLCAMHVLRRQAEAGNRRGRPRVLYELSGGGTASARLTEAPSGAWEAGRRWALSLTPSPSLSPREAHLLVSELLDRLGYRPEAHPDEGTVSVHHCPFAEVARYGRTAVCGAHLSLLRALVGQVEAGLEVALEPLVVDGPSVCTVRLTERRAARGGS
jgi:predicted ArsR family transcriptional regulator